MDETAQKKRMLLRSVSKIAGRYFAAWYVFSVLSLRIALLDREILSMAAKLSVRNELTNPTAINKQESEKIAAEERQLWLQLKKIKDAIAFLYGHISAGHASREVDTVRDVMKAMQHDIQSFRNIGKDKFVFRSLSVLFQTDLNRMETLASDEKVLTQELSTMIEGIRSDREVDQEQNLAEEDGDQRAEAKNSEISKPALDIKNFQAGKMQVPPSDSQNSAGVSLEKRWLLWRLGRSGARRISEAETKIRRKLVAVKP
ncbi:hypothetical protein HDU82_000842 [Entophlyctis luteolus]|nr:hypothetical protein HDU82_000842 [Entophlyctis luteolus]